MATRTWMTLLTALSLNLGGCNLIGPNMVGDWEVDVVDADDCNLEMEIEQKQGELTGEADLSCRLFFDIYGEQFYYDMVEDGLDLNEIQAHSGLSVSAIKSRLHRARRRIKAAIEARFGPGALMPA